MKNSVVVYLTENLIPEKKDNRPPLLLLFGNPASHSVAAKMFFAYEGSGREHRIWNTLSKAGIPSFPSIPTSVSQKSLNERNRLRKKALLELNYDSDFRIGLAVFFTMSSPASCRPWTGVTGLRSLLSKGALDRVGEGEKERVCGIIRNFVSPNGAVIAFQKDAYQAIKSPESPGYSLAETKEGHLAGNCRYDPGIALFCVPPTRQARADLDCLLRKFRDRILSG